MRMISGERVRYLASVVVLVFILSCALGCATSRVCAMAIPKSDFPSEAATVPSIVWEAAVVESGITTIDGYVRFPQGGLELAWVVDSSQKAVLQTLDPSGSAELPSHAVRIRPVLLDDGTALLAKDFHPLLNSKQPVSVKILGAVEASNLLAPLELIEIPQGSTTHQRLSRATFGEQYEIQGGRVQEGMISNISGSLSLLWQKTLDGSYKLARVERGLEIPLIPLLDNRSATAFIFQIRTAEVQGIRLDYLWYVGKTTLEELLEGFRRL